MTVQGNLQWSCLSICSFLCKICEFYKLAQIVMWGSPRRPCHLGTRHVVRLPSRGLEKTNSHIIFILKMLLLADAAEFRSMLSSNILLVHLPNSNIRFYSRRQWCSYQQRTSKIGSIWKACQDFILLANYINHSFLDEVHFCPHRSFFDDVITWLEHLETNLK